MRSKSHLSDSSKVERESRVGCAFLMLLFGISEVYRVRPGELSCGFGKTRTDLRVSYRLTKQIRLYNIFGIMEMLLSHAQAVLKGVASVSGYATKTQIHPQTGPIHSKRG